MHLHYTVIKKFLSRFVLSLPERIPTEIWVQETQLQAGMIQPGYSIHVVKGDSCLHIITYIVLYIISLIKTCKTKTYNDAPSL